MRFSPPSPLAAVRPHARPSARRPVRRVASAASRRPGVYEVLEERRLLALTNGGFEAGNTSGWTTDPMFGFQVNTSSHDQPTTPLPEGRFFAELSPSFELNRYATLSNTFQAQPGDVIAGNAFFASHDFANRPNTDDGYVVIKNAQTGEVTTLFYAGTATGDPATTVGPGGKTPWTEFRYEFTEAGTYKIEAGVANKGVDSGGNSHLGLDNVRFTGGDAAPGTTPPLVDLGGPYTVPEGQTVVLKAEVFDADENTRTYSWDRNGDGVYETTNASPYLSMSSFELSSRGAGDGPSPLLTVGVRVTDANGNTATDTATVQVVNAPPRIVNWPSFPLSGPEGIRIPLTANITDPAGTRDTITARWTITKDGQPYSDVTTNHPFALSEFFGDDNGTYVITLTASDEDGGTSAPMSRTIVLQNMTPTVRTLTGPATGVRGQEREYSATFFDNGPADTHTTAWTVLNEAGEMVASGTGTEFAFTPAEAGTYTVNFAVTDDDGARGTRSAPLVVSAAETQADPADPEATILAVGGTTGKDHIELVPGASDDSVEVFIDDVSQGVFTGVTAVRVFGQAGDDHLRVQNRLGVPVTFFGGDGDDLLITNNFSDVLIGGDGEDRLVGRRSVGGEA